MTPRRRRPGDADSPRPRRPDTQGVVDRTLAHFAAQKYANAQAHPRIALYRDALKGAAGVSAKKYPQSHESLLKRLLKEQRPPRAISPAVDFYHSVSVEHVVTAGAFDLAELRKEGAQPSLELRVARVDEDAFVPLDAAPGTAPGRVDTREILYAQGPTVLTRHLAWRQSAQALVTEATRDIMFMSEVLHEADVGAEPSSLARAVADSLQQGLKTMFGIDSRVEYLGKGLGKLEADL